MSLTAPVNKDYWLYKERGPNRHKLFQLLYYGEEEGGWGLDSRYTAL